ncbi:hypothetical protein B0H14DRAFT_3161240 [Mycena olivaceomarginata]|nr:hypothetical protein B0H14DRAFT_3161240 [Mycena olivaceomarginata]
MDRAGINDDSDGEEEGEEFGFTQTNQQDWFPHGSRTDWANPLVRPFIHIYPEVSGPIAEFWQADKWTSEIGLDELSPMWADWENKAASHRHFFVNELARQYDGTYVVPVRWITVENVVHADVHDVKIIRRPEGDLFEVGTGSYSRIAAKTLALNYLDLRAALRPINFAEYSPHYEMPHPLREKACGRPMFRLRVMPWSDDVSGNVSKQYNAHTNMYVTNLNLPHQKLAQEYFVRFTSTSPHASSSELFVALGDDFIPGTWHDAYDCDEEAILFEIIPHVLPAVETASHIGMAGNLCGRKDLNGGPKAYQETSTTWMPGSSASSDRSVTVKSFHLWYRLELSLRARGIALSTVLGYMACVALRHLEMHKAQCVDTLHLPEFRLVCTATDRMALQQVYLRYGKKCWTLSTADSARHLKCRL